ncbi:MAG: hypothetical protein U9M89_00595, partial [Patescibacteria group bacterium]|nr:hypothetical protein [Patescibacteria group bacterium]
VEIKLPKSDENLDVIIQIAKNLKSKTKGGETKSPPPNKPLFSIPDFSNQVPKEEKDEPKKETRAPKIKGENWTKREYNILKKQYEKRTVNQIIEQGFLPGRSVTSAKSALRRMKIGKHNKHLHVYPIDTDVYHLLIARIKGKTKMKRNDIKRMIVEEYDQRGKNISGNSIRTYSSNTINYLLRNEPRFRKIGHNVYSYDESITGEKEPFEKTAPNENWTPGETNKLIKVYRTHPVSYILENNFFPGRSESSIVSKIRRMGLKKHGHHAKPRQNPHIPPEITIKVIERMDGEKNLTREIVSNLIKEEYQGITSLQESTTRQYASILINYLLREVPHFIEIRPHEYSFDLNGNRDRIFSNIKEGYEQTYFPIKRIQWTKEEIEQLDILYKDYTIREIYDANMIPDRNYEALKTALTRYGIRKNGSVSPKNNSAIGMNKKTLSKIVKSFEGNPQFTSEDILEAIKKEYKKEGKQLSKVTLHCYVSLFTKHLLENDPKFKRIAARTYSYVSLEDAPMPTLDEDMNKWHDLWTKEEETKLEELYKEHTVPDICANKFFAGRTRKAIEAKIHKLKLKKPKKKRSRVTPSIKEEPDVKPLDKPKPKRYKLVNFQDHLEKRVKEMRARERKFTAARKQEIKDDIYAKLENKRGAVPT